MASLGGLHQLGLLLHFWGGMICGMALQTLILLVIVYRTNWNKEVISSSAWP